MLIDRKELLLKDKKIIVRSADVQDALSLCNHRYITASESYFMARYPEECSINEENMKARIIETKEKESDFFVTAFYDQKVIGDLGVSRVRNQIKFCHRAYMGISIQKDYNRFHPLLSTQKQNQQRRATNHGRTQSIPKLCFRDRKGKYLPCLKGRRRIYNRPGGAWL